MEMACSSGASRFLSEGESTRRRSPFLAYSRQEPEGPMARVPPHGLKLGNVGETERNVPASIISLALTLFAVFITHVDPESAFNRIMAVALVAMAMVYSVHRSFEIFSFFYLDGSNNPREGSHCPRRVFIWRFPDTFVAFIMAFSGVTYLIWLLDDEQKAWNGVGNASEGVWKAYEKLLYVTVLASGSGITQFAPDTACSRLWISFVTMYYYFTSAFVFAAGVNWCARMREEEQQQEEEGENAAVHQIPPAQHLSSHGLYRT